MEIPNLSINNGSPDWGLHRFEDNVVFHCAKNPNGFWTAIGPAKEQTKPIKLVLGQVNIQPALHLVEDKNMSGVKKAFPKDKAEKKASKTEKKSVKTADKKEKKAVKATKKSKKS
jgi:hypothetical protein